jgi:hypothetical protein
MYTNIKEKRCNILTKISNQVLTKWNKRHAKKEDAEDTIELMEDINAARKEWIDASINYEFADDVDTIDYYSYKIKACQVRYNQLIKIAKIKGINLDSCKIV